MQNQNDKRKDDKRSGSDRRAQAIGLDFPFIDSHGHLVTEERRKSNRRKTEPFDDNSLQLEQQTSYA